MSNPVLHETVPKEIILVAKTLENAGFSAYLVGGCVRDTLLGRKPKDWDITTNAKPEDIIRLFPHTFYENTYGTVGVVLDDVSDETLKTIEITPFRKEIGYSDHRRPDQVIFGEKLEEDLERRDFTINALALRVIDEKTQEIIDIFGGIVDLQQGIIKAVGKPEARFQEDALRMLRAIRFAAELGFALDTATKTAIKDNSPLLAHISRERVRDEFTRILMSDRPMAALLAAKELGILGFITPKLLEAHGIEQNQAHAYDVLEHLLRSLQCAADKKYPLDIRIAALFHDISKPETRRFDKAKGEYTFYGHEVVGSRETKKILDDLRFPKEMTEKVVKLIRWHMFFTDTEAITLSAVRRMVANVGKENIWDLMDVRICDRVGTGRPKENPYRLRKYKSMIEEVLRDPISVGQLKIDGHILMKEIGVKPGPRLGFMLHALLGEVLENPALNTPEKLKEMAQNMDKLSDTELRQKGEAGKQLKESEDEALVEEIRKKHGVK